MRPIPISPLLGRRLRRPSAGMASCDMGRNRTSVERHVPSKPTRTPKEDMDACVAQHRLRKHGGLVVTPRVEGLAPETIAQAMHRAPHRERGRLSPGGTALPPRDERARRPHHDHALPWRRYGDDAGVRQVPPVEVLPHLALPWASCARGRGADGDGGRRSPGHRKRATASHPPSATRWQRPSCPATMRRAASCMPGRVRRGRGHARADHRVPRHHRPHRLPGDGLHWPLLGGPTEAALAAGTASVRHAGRLGSRGRTGACYPYDV